MRLKCVMSNNSTIFIAGHNGMVGSALYRELSKGQNCIITKSRSELNLTRQSEVEDFFLNNHIDEVYLAAAKVGGILANRDFPAEFIYENLMIESNVIHAAHKNGVKKLLFLGSSCIYPKITQQPINETALLNGSLEPTNEPYAIAKIAGIKLCESYNRQFKRDYRSVMPTNLYGQHDNFHPKNSHVIPAMIRRFHEAKLNRTPEVLIWGSGTPKRDFLHVDDMAKASIHVMNMDHNIYQSHTQEMLSHINIGSGVDCSIKELAETIKEVVDYKGEISFDTSKPDGTLRKLLDVSRIKQLGWSAKINLEAGLKHTYQWFLKNYSDLRK